MNELNNKVVANGIYNNIPTSLTSNTSVVNIIEDLTLTKEADKQNWSSGILTYTITINNETEVSYPNSKITTLINPNLVEFIPSSVKIDNLRIPEKEYNYDKDSHILTVISGLIEDSTSKTIKFSVKKKSNKPFRLISDCTLNYSTKTITSNKVVVISTIPIYHTKNLGCDTPYWRI